MDTLPVIRTRQGDEAAFAVITRGVYVRLRAVAYRILRDPHLAEDATQVARLGIWRKPPGPSARPATPPAQPPCDRG